MQKITLKEYKDLLCGTFYRLGYVKSIVPVEEILQAKNWSKEDIAKNDAYVADFRSHDMVMHNQSVKEGEILEKFNSGDAYVSHEQNGVIYLFHIYSDIDNVSIKAI